jgi:DNA-binding winged helix-turn-helix (wHTH) protein
LFYPWEKLDNLLGIVYRAGGERPGVEFSFGDHHLDVDRRELRRGAELIAVEPQVFDLLVHLIRNRERVVSKDDLIATVWRGRIVSDSTITSHIHAARKAVGDSGDAQRLIRTVPRKGIRFVATVEDVFDLQDKAATRRLATILAADVAGYSRLMGADEEETHERLQGHLRELVDRKVEEHRGRIVKNTGDGLLAELRVLWTRYVVPQRSNGGWSIASPRCSNTGGSDFASA